MASGKLEIIVYELYLQVLSIDVKICKVNQLYPYSGAFFQISLCIENTDTIKVILIKMKKEIWNYS